MHRVRAGCPAGGEEARGCGLPQKNERHRRERHGICGTNAEEQARQEAREQESHGEAEPEAHADQRDPVAENHPQHGPWRGAESHPDTELLEPLADGEREHARDPGRGDHEREHGKEGGEQRRQARGGAAI
ncbi:MAG: hypothetical protein LC780_15360, partial [Acidobacteria bacterium]|nr:hypothetical protein [Acidobacteriota bacterium]